MKLTTFNGDRIGVVIGETICDVTEVCPTIAGEWPPVGMTRLIGKFAAFREAIEARVASASAVPIGDVILTAPIPWPNKLLAYPVNYLAHGAEMNSQNRADRNGFFLKSPASLVGAGGAIALPDFPGRSFHHECELAIIIGRRAHHISTDEALDYVFGYSCIIDVTLRGNEERVWRKSFDSFSPLGPWIVTSDELGDPSNLDAKLWVNDDLRQHANTRDLIVDVPNMIARAAACTTLEPGDIIATGTPAGVGPIVPGDSVTIEIQRIGRMTIAVTSERPVSVA